MLHQNHDASPISATTLPQVPEVIGVSRSGSADMPKKANASTAEGGAAVLGRSNVVKHRTAVIDDDIGRIVRGRTAVAFVRPGTTLRRRASVVFRWSIGWINVIFLCSHGQL
jgi:hypothetical protein